MIRTRTLLVLLAITVAIVVGALITAGLRRHEEPAPTEELLLPNLAGHINDVAEVEVTTTNDRRVDLKRTADGWVDASRGGYPARFEPVKQLLVALTEAKIAEHKTSNPEFYDRLGVTDRDAPDSRSTQVTLRDESGATLASVLIGDRRQGGSGRFVRPTEQSEVVLTAGEITASAMPLSWLEREVIRVPRDEVQRVSVAHPNGNSYSIVRTPDGKFDMIGVPQGRRVRAQSPLAGVVGALAYVDFQDVKPMDSVNFDSLRPPFLATYETEDGMSIDVSVWMVDKKKWTTFSVAKAPDAGDSGVEESAPDESKGETLDEKIARLQKKLDGWIYEVSPSSLVPLQTSILELTQEIPAEEPANGPPAPPANPASAPQPQQSTGPGGG